ncbi:glycosyltransferase [Paenibacillus sp. sgz302251]|uniref:glycosyltransferase n=1 Tax=Paenibacillus sp. sgz302251 TaxID=3414493 RepID=UPI003C7A23B8
MEIILLAVVVMLAAQLLFAAWNVRQLPLFEQLGTLTVNHNVPDPAAAAASTLRLSILIPARNEERHIEACLRAIQQCLPSDPSIEIIVLDDRSEDRTASLMEPFMALDSRFRCISGQEPPSGWVGKAYACHQLSQAARGEWFLFIDADARIQPGAIESVLQATSAQRSGLITGFPHQETGSWLEKLVVPMMGFTIACHLPIKLVSASRDARFTAAHGAWIAVHHATYAESGGHAANFGHLVDDVALMRAVKRIGHPATLADVRRLVSMRMYQNATEVWSGYKKNIYAGVGRSGVVLLTMLTLYALLYVLPFVALVGSLFEHSLLIPALTAYLLGVAVKAVADRSQGQSIWLAWFIPFSIGAVIAIGAASWLSAKTGAGYIWKGRSYE